MESIMSIYDNIFRVLGDSVWGMTIEELSNKLGLHRNTISRYLHKLESLGLVIKKQIGKYTLWLPRTVYNYHKTGVVRAFIEGVIDFLMKLGDSDLVRKLGFSVAEYIMNYLKSKEDIFLLRGSPKEAQELLGVHIPTLIPRLRVKVARSEYSDKVVFIDLLGCPNEGKDFKSVCEFFLGYVEGTIRSLKIPFRSIELVESLKDEGECVYSVVLDVSIDEASKYLLSIYEV